MSATDVMVSFEGTLRKFSGRFERRTSWDALKKGAMGWGICWILCVVFAFIPYVNVSVFLIFLPLGPMVMTVIYFVSKRTIKSIEGETVCVRCEKTVKIHERDVTPPIYEHCPECKAGFEILIPAR
ncbi:MAG: hypothetical protein EOP10_17975 [Proteobacteria bacterium]|nr:MAG: hypothetical protein EOP10_17975 [Pseudomonadota bacterium]